MSLLPVALSPLPSMLTWQLPSLWSKTRLLLPALAPSPPPSLLLALLLVPYPSLPPLLAPSPWIWTVPGVSRVHSPWRSVVVALTLASAPIVASQATHWPPARWHLAPARPGALSLTFPSSPPRIRLLLQLQLLLPPLLLLQLLPLLELLLRTRPVTCHSGIPLLGTLQPGFLLQLFPTRALSRVPGRLSPLPSSPLPPTPPSTPPPCQKTDIPASRDLAGRHFPPFYPVSLPHSLPPYLASPRPRSRPAACSHPGSSRLGGL